jgi:hypothetical protein
VVVAADGPSLLVFSLLLFLLAFNGYNSEVDVLKLLVLLVVVDVVVVVVVDV